MVVKEVSSDMAGFQVERENGGHQMELCYEKCMIWRRILIVMFMLRLRRC